MAIATLDMARSLGLSVPRDLSLISFDNTPLARFTQPALTAIDQPIAATTSKAVELIISAKRGDVIGNSLTVVPATLVERESVSHPPGEAGA
jgi:LacI family transcriptional regulator